VARSALFLSQLMPIGAGEARASTDLTRGQSAPAGLDATANRDAPEVAIVIPTLNERANVSVLVQRLAGALDGVSWEAIFVDDDSVDGTIDEIRRIAQRDTRIRGIRRISRRGLAGASLEGMLSTSADFIVVMDGDLQHDETQIKEMLSMLRSGEADVVVGSRYLASGGAGSGLSDFRKRGSRTANRLAQLVLRRPMSDPMSGFFMLRRDVVEGVARKLSQRGFKILLDLIASSPPSLLIREIPFEFQPRLHGESKLDSAVVLDYAGLLVSKASGGFLSIRFLLFGLVGSSGVLVNLGMLAILLARHIGFAEAQTVAMLTAMVSNYSLNNALTYRDRRRRGWRFLTGLASFAALCSLGIVAGVGVSTLLYQAAEPWWLAGIAGAMMGAMWNYVATSAITWPSS
jgi:dolichol-phosphate mannosyltransferase